ncbi:MAG: hypothetical protein MOGMAGMI_00184 [Candidatus Omnitrophica bacterium]|nr:hypothetical protein [Candidatus Omnitrophota bacterium]
MIRLILVGFLLGIGIYLGLLFMRWISGASRRR